MCIKEFYLADAQNNTYTVRAVEQSGKPLELQALHNITATLGGAVKHVADSRLNMIATEHGVDFLAQGQIVLRDVEQSLQQHGFSRTAKPKPLPVAT